jgi:TonB family protein
MRDMNRISFGVLALSLLLVGCSGQKKDDVNPSPHSKGSEPRPGPDAVVVSSPARPSAQILKSGALTGCLAQDDHNGFMLHNREHLKGVNIESDDVSYNRLMALVSHKIKVTGNWEKLPDEPEFFEAAQAEDIANACASVQNEVAADPPRAGENGYGTPVCLYCPQPGFSEEAIRAKHFDAIVVLEALVTADGRATNVHVIKAVGLGLDIKALEIIPTWRFKPALGPDGRAAPVVTRIECKFHLDSTAGVMPR